MAKKGGAQSTDRRSTAAAGGTGRRVLTARKVSEEPIMVIVEDEAEAPESGASAGVAIADADGAPGVAEWPEGDDDGARGLEDEEIEPKSDLEILLEQHSQSEDFWLRVEKLYNYHHDGRADAAAARRFVMNIKPPTLDYEESIARAQPAGGAFLIKLYQRGRGILRYWDVHIEGSAGASDSSSAAAAAAAPSQASDPIEEFIKQARRMAELREYLFPEAASPPAAAAAAPPAAPPRAASLDELLVEEAKTNAELRARIIDRAFRDERDEAPTGVRAIVAEVLKEPDAALAILQQAIGLLRGGGVAGSGEAAAAAAYREPQSAIEAARAVVATITDDLTHNRHVGRSAFAVVEASRRWPELVQFWDQFVERAPQFALTELSRAARVNLLEYAHAERWIGDLQAALLGDGGDGDDGDDGDGGDDGAGDDGAGDDGGGAGKDLSGAGKVGGADDEGVLNETIISGSF